MADEVKRDFPVIKVNVLPSPIDLNKFYPKVYQVQKLEDQKVVFQIPIAKLIKYIDIEILDETDNFSGTRATVNSLKLTAENE